MSISEPEPQDYVLVDNLRGGYVACEYDGAMRELTYLDPTTVQAVKRTTNTLRYGMASSGYTLASGAPMPYMLRIRNRWYRLMIWQFSNVGSLFVRILGKPHHVNEAEIDALWEAMYP